MKMENTKLDFTLHLEQIISKRSYNDSKGWSYKPWDTVTRVWVTIAGGNTSNGVAAAGATAISARSTG